MAIRLRTVNGVRIALCAAETDPMPGDVYLDDGDHYALAAKFSRDWAGQVAGWEYPVEWAAMDTQKVRDAATELEAWLSSVVGRECVGVTA
ncbi:hypothetical protein [Dongia deserti]|uniref:hypothetical protein n=1 Tax=Dongia deserti TaxID=2268030 RepID=UPI000E64C487|nr:hypothetical protein [Dongia deserti]